MITLTDIEVFFQFSHLLMIVQHDKKVDTGKLNFGQYHCIIANREVIVILGNQDTVVLYKNQRQQTILNKACL